MKGIHFSVQYNIELPGIALGHAGLANVLIVFSRRQSGPALPLRLSKNNLSQNKFLLRLNSICLQQKWNEHIALLKTEAPPPQISASLIIGEQGTKLDLFPYLEIGLSISCYETKWRRVSWQGEKRDHTFPWEQQVFQKFYSYIIK